MQLVILFMALPVCALTGDGIDGVTFGRFRLSGGDDDSLATAAFIAPKLNRESNNELLELFDLFNGKSIEAHYLNEVVHNFVIE